MYGLPVFELYSFVTLATTLRGVFRLLDKDMYMTTLEVASETVYILEFYRECRYGSLTDYSCFGCKTKAKVLFQPLSDSYFISSIFFLNKLN